MKVFDEKLLKSNIEKRAKEDIEKQNISGAAVAVLISGLIRKMKLPRFI